MLRWLTDDHHVGVFATRHASRHFGVRQAMVLKSSKTRMFFAVLPGGERRLLGIENRGSSHIYPSE